MKEDEVSKKGFHMPAEWENHEGTWLQWPHDGMFRGYQMKLESIWLTMVDILHKYERVHIIVSDERHRDHVMHQLKYFNISLETIDLYTIPSNDVWARDNGPIFVVSKDGDLAITNWMFNGWGNRFEYRLDNQVPAIIGDMLSIPVLNPPLTLEGGAVEVNGNGTFMATRTSIINPNRNPGKNQEEIEAIIKTYLGVKHFIWLSGMAGQECEKLGGVTDTHIDGVARFTGVSTVLYNWTDDKLDPRYSFLLKHFRELQEATTESGKPLTLVPLPIPKDGVYRINPAYWRTTTLTIASYCNFLVANGFVLIPVYGNVNDDRAKGIITEQFPGREVVGIEAVSLVENGGMIHCVTQQQPFTTRS